MFLFPALENRLPLSQEPSQLQSLASLADGSRGTQEESPAVCKASACAVAISASQLGAHSPLYSLKGRIDSPTHTYTLEQGFLT